VKKEYVKPAAESRDRSLSHYSLRRTGVPAGGTGADSDSIRIGWQRPKRPGSITVGPRARSGTTVTAPHGVAGPPAGPLPVRRRRPAAPAAQRRGGQGQPQRLRADAESRAESDSVSGSLAGCPPGRPLAGPPAARPAAT
jgi:hypothetical protein